MSEDAGRRAENDYLQPGALRQQVQHAQERALASGALQPIAAVPETMHDHGIAFTVWRLTDARTPLSAGAIRPEKPAWSETGANPFLPYDAALFVCGVSDTHVCLLNKYNVLDQHLLLVTRSFELQTDWLTLADFEALRLCMAEFDGLAFYNGGKAAGASQRHKHLQYAPFPLSPLSAEPPIAAALAGADWEAGIGTVEAFPFVHALVSLEIANASGRRMLELYRLLLSAAGMPPGSGAQQTSPYNMLATREWMMIAPRSRESYEEISVNALGYAGSLLVRDDAQMRRLREAGPLSVLTEVGIPRLPPSPA